MKQLRSQLPKLIVRLVDLLCRRNKLLKRSIYRIIPLYLITFVTLFCRTSAIASGVALEGLAIPKWNQQLMEQNAVMTR